jgi:5-methylcytosine-specific restriction endonuclease McrA
MNSKFTNQDNPRLCECGCGEVTTCYRGIFRHFIYGHSMKGRKRPDISKLMSGENSPSKRPEVRARLSDSHKGIPHSEERKRKMSEARKGPKHWNWNGGSSFLPYSPEFTDELKQFIKDRDNNECQNPYCDHKAKRLDIHHIDYNKQNCSQFNLIALCMACNTKANINRKDWEPFYKKIIWSRY